MPEGESHSAFWWLDPTKVAALHHEAAQLEARVRTLRTERDVLEKAGAIPHDSDALKSAYEQAYRDSFVKVSERGKFVGAVLAGVLAAILFGLITVWGASCQAKNERTIAQRVAFQADLFQKQSSAVDRFGEQFPAAAYRAFQLRLEYAEIMKEYATLGAPPPQDAPDAAKLSYASGLADYSLHLSTFNRMTVADYLSKPNILTLASTADAFFGDQTRVLADTLRADADALMDAGNEQEAKTRYDRLDQRYTEVMKAMTSELRKTKDDLETMQYDPRGI